MMKKSIATLLLSLVASVASIGLRSPHLKVRIPDAVHAALTNTTKDNVLSGGIEHGRVGRVVALTNSQKAIILDKHNVLRANVATPCAAADMETLQWDDTLAAKAEEYAAKCLWAHDNAVNHEHNWGENMALSVTGTSLEGLVQGWYDEILDVHWTAGEATISASDLDSQHCVSPNTDTGKCQITHYTQLIGAETNKVGCGWAACDSVAGLNWWSTQGKMFVCKYSPGGNKEDFHGNLLAPFQVGQVAAACNKRSSQANVAGRLCAAGDRPNRCRDELGFSLFEVHVDDTIYTDCNTLVQKFPAQCAAKGATCKNWCTDFAQTGAPRHWCDRTCKVCSDSEQVGAAHCY